MIVGLHHVAIGVPDFEAALSFYCEAFGLEIVQRSEFSGENPLVERAIGVRQPGARMAMLRAANAHIELWQYTEPEPRDRRSDPNDYGYPHVAFEVQDIEAEHARLTAAGMTFVGPPVDFGESSAVYGRDPWGNVIEIYELRNPTSARLSNTPMAIEGAT